MLFRARDVLESKSIKKYSYFLFPIYVFILLIIGFSLVTPMGETMKIDFEGETPVLSSLPENTISTNDCKLENGVFVSTGLDPFIVFNTSGKTVKALSAKFNTKNTDEKVVLYYNIGGGFNEGNSISFNPSENEDFTFVQQTGKLVQVRFDFQKKLELEKVDYYKKANVSYESVDVDSIYPPIIIAVSVILGILLVIIEGKTRAVEKFFAAIGKNAKSILIFIIGICSSAIVGVILTYLAYLLKHKFSIYVFFFMFGAVAVIFEILFFSKTAGKKTENLFLAVCLTMGMTMILITPVGHVSWDTGSHYRYALMTSSPRTEYDMGDLRIMSNSPGSFASDNLDGNIARYTALNNESKQAGGILPFSPNIAHFASGVAVKTAKFFGASFIEAYMLGKVPMLLIYAFACYFAIKKLKSGKMLLSVIALFPTSLFLATNYSYDYWVICFSFLGIAYFYSNVQEPQKPISDKDIYIMYGALLLACIPKAIYLTLLIIPLFMPWKKIPNKWKYYLTCVASFLLLFGIFFIKAKASVSGGGDSRGGGDIDSAAQLAGIIGDPFGYAKVLFNFLKNFLSIREMHGYISSFAYLTGGKCANVFIALIMILVIIDKNKYDAETSKWYYKAVAAAVYIGTAAMIATALYIDFTPVGYNTVNGCQHRYITPLLLPICYTIGSFKKHIAFFEKYRAVINTIAFSACSCAVLYDVCRVILVRMV